MRISARLCEEIEGYLFQLRRVGQAGSDSFPET
jgi:hypothetical protein